MVISLTLFISETVNESYLGAYKVGSTIIIPKVSTDTVA